MKTESRQPPLRSALGASLLLLALGACGGDDLLLPSAGEPAQITIVDGNNQIDTVGRPLADSLVVEVTDPENRPVNDVEVIFVAPTGAVLMPNDTVVTGPDGRASVYYRLATAAGEQIIEARAQHEVPSPSLTTTFRAIAHPETAVELVGAGGDDQEGEVQTALAESLAVVVVDRFGNGVPGVEIAWLAPDGGVSPEIILTGPDGRAATQRTLGLRPGTYSTSAAATGLEGSPVLFEATGEAPPSPQVLLVTQPSSSAAAGVPFERQPVLQLQDALGAPLARADVAVTVQIAEGSGSLGGTTTVRSNADGRVSFTDLSIRGRPGNRMLLFAAVDFTPATSELIDVNPGPPDASRSSASVPNGTAGAATTISIQLEDEFGTRVEDASDAVSVRVEGENARDVPVTEQGGGSYTADYTPRVAGTDRVRVLVNGTPVDDSPFDSRVQPGPAAAFTTTAEVTKSGAVFYHISIRVTTRDAQGNLRGRGGERVQIQFNGSNVLRDAQDNGDGTYSDDFITVSFSPTIVILLNGVPISGNPYIP